MGEQRGKTLDRLLRAGPLNADETAELFDAMLDALDRAHRGGGTHGAITPEKIMVLADRPPALLDADDADRQAFRDGPYAAPELAVAGDDAGAAGDVYALAAVLYRAVTGAPPSGGSGRAALAETRPEGFAPPMLEAIDAGLAPEPRDRPRSIQAWRAMWSADAPTAYSDDDPQGRAAPQPAAGVASPTAPAAAGPAPAGKGGGPALAGVIAGVLWLAPLLAVNLYAVADPAGYWAVSDAIWNSGLPSFLTGVLDLGYVLLPVIVAGALLPVALAAGGLRAGAAGVAVNAAAWVLAPVINELVLRTGWFAEGADAGGIPADLVVADGAIGLIGGAGLALAAGLGARRLAAAPLVVGPLVWMVAMAAASVLAAAALADAGDTGWAVLYSAIFALAAALATVSTAALQRAAR